MRYPRSSGKKSSADRQHSIARKPKAANHVPKKRVHASASSQAQEEQGRTFSMKDMLDPYWSWRFVRMG